MHGDAARVYRWASVTKPVTALACLVAAEEGTIDLDEPAGPPGSTFRHLLAHASGLPLDGGEPDRAAGRAADLLRPRLRRPRRGARRPRRDAVRRLPARGACSEPLGLARPLRGATRLGRCTARSTTCSRSGASCSRRRSSRRRRSPRRRRCSSRAWSACCRASAARSRTTGASASSSATRKSPHWTGTRNSPRTFGHFGRSGTFLWVDPEAGVALGCLTDLRLRRLGDGGVAGALRRGAGGARQVSGGRVEPEQGCLGACHCCVLRHAVRGAARVGTAPGRARSGRTTCRAGRPVRRAPGISQLAPDLAGLRTSRRVEAACRRSSDDGDAIRVDHVQFATAEGGGRGAEAGSGRRLPRRCSSGAFRGDTVGRGPGVGLQAARRRGPPAGQRHGRGLPASARGRSADPRRARLGARLRRRRCAAGCARRRAQSLNSGRMNSSNVSRSQLATTDGVSARTEAVRGMSIVSATSPK